MQSYMEAITGIVFVNLMLTIMQEYYSRFSFFNAPLFQMVIRIKSQDSYHITRYWDNMVQWLFTSPCTNGSGVQIPLRAVCATGYPNPCWLSQIFSEISGFLLLSKLGRVWFNQKHPFTQGEWGAVVLKVDVTIKVLIGSCA